MTEKVNMTVHKVHALSLMLPAFDMQLTIESCEQRGLKHPPPHDMHYMVQLATWLVILSSC